MERLARLGLDGTRRAEFDEARTAAMVALTLGRVARVDRGEVLVFAEDDELRAMSDSQRTQGLVAPVTGDWVTVCEDDEVGLLLHDVLDRRTALTRRDPAEHAIDQVLASNIDKVAVVQGLDQPANDARIERFLVLAMHSRAEPLVILTKADIGSASPEDYADLAAVAPVIVTALGDRAGIEELQRHLGDGATIAFIGPSGAGKSTLVNELVGEEVAETGDVRTGDRRGRHTTTHRELIELPHGGSVIDTPGIRAIGLWSADIALDEVFVDIAERAASCRFRDCTHRSEPGCAVTAAVDAGEVDPARLARYQLLWQELAEQAEEIERQKRRPTRGRRRR